MAEEQWLHKNLCIRQQQRTTHTHTKRTFFIHNASTASTNKVNTDCGSDHDAIRNLFQDLKCLARALNLPLLRTCRDAQRNNEMQNNYHTRSSSQSRYPWDANRDQARCGHQSWSGPHTNPRAWSGSRSQKAEHQPRSGPRGAPTRVRHIRINFQLRTAPIPIRIGVHRFPTHTLKHPKILH